MAVWVAIAVWWRRWAVRELAGRTRVELVPAATFDPELLEVRRVAGRPAVASYGKSGFGKTEKALVECPRVVPRARPPPPGRKTQGTTAPPRAGRHPGRCGIDTSGQSATP